MASRSAAQRARQSQIEIATPAIIGAVIAGICAVIYRDLAEDLALSPRILAFDRFLTASIQSWRAPALTVLFRGATLSADTLTVTILVLIAVAVLVWTCNHREAVVLAVVVAIGTGLGNVAKRITERPRPPAANAIIELPASFAFPSGHTLAAVLFWTLLAWIVVRTVHSTWIRVLAVVGGIAMAVLVGTSRVYLGVHWPSDVLASWILGIGWLALSMGIFFSWERWAGPLDE